MKRKVYIDANGTLYGVLYSDKRLEWKVHKLDNTGYSWWRPCTARCCFWRKDKEDAFKDLDILASNRRFVQIKWTGADLCKARGQDDTIRG